MGRIGKYEEYVLMAVKLPKGLRERIDELARTQQGKPITRNGWVVRELARRAKWGEFTPTKKNKEVKEDE